MPGKIWLDKECFDKVNMVCGKIRYAEMIMYSSVKRQSYIQRQLSFSNVDYLNWNHFEGDTSQY